MDPTYARYGKDFCAIRSDKLGDTDNQNWPLFHVHDVGHNLRNTEASFERGSHFDGITSYVEDKSCYFVEMYRMLSQGPQHRAVLQYDKQ